VEDANVQADKDRSEAIYQEPPGVNEGTVRIQSLGIMELRQHGANENTSALHIRMTLSKDVGSAPWTFNTREIFLSTRFDPRVVPTFAQVDSGILPNLEIKNGGLRTIDLYFTKFDDRPSSEESVAESSQFNLRWTLQSGFKRVVENTKFESIPVLSNYATYPEEAIPAPSDPYFEYGLGAENEWEAPQSAASLRRLRR
jgi:hypothetical protein